MSVATVTCGFQGTDFILGDRRRQLEEILKRRQQEPPAWLVDLRKQLPVERVSTVVYLNLKMLLDQMTADKAMPKTREALRRLGLDKLSALSSVSGLEGETFTSKLLLSTEGEPQGPLLSLFSDQPLRAGDLTPIPRDATLALAMRFDAQKAVDQFAAMVEKAEPAERAAIEGPWDALTKSLQVDLRRELPKALGDTLLRLQFARRRRPGAAGPHGRRADQGSRRGLRDPSQDRSAVPWPRVFRTSSTKDPACRRCPCSVAAASLMQFRRPEDLITSPAWALAPAWCATDRELIVAMTPQNIMAYLQHGPAHKSLATVPQVAD